MNTTYDVAVLGLGTMGSYTALEMARRGYSVIGFDRFAPPHSHGSHSGESRIYRVAYPEGSNYVPLARQAGDMWDELGGLFGTTLLHRVGMLHMGPAQGSFIAEVAESARVNALAIAQHSAAEVRERYPAFQIPDGFVGMLDPAAGWLDVSAAIRHSHQETERLGATLRLDTPVIGWKALGGFVTVTTANAEYRAARLIVTAGAWASTLMRELKLPLTIRRKVLAWFEPRRPELFAPGRIPVFAFPDHWTYGFPNIDGLGVKLAEHLGGADLASADSALAEPGPEDLDPIRATAAKYMPALDQAKLLRTQVCFYTLSPDEDFIVDRHPFHSNVVFAAGFSGHGFKFAPLVGRALADLSINDVTRFDIDFWRLRQF